MMILDHYHSALNYLKCRTVQTWRRNEREFEYRCDNGHQFDAPWDVNWASPERCWKRNDELWEPYRINIDIEGFDGLNVEAGTEDMHDLVDQFIEAIVSKQNSDRQEGETCQLAQASRQPRGRTFQNLDGEGKELGSSGPWEVVL